MGALLEICVDSTDSARAAKAGGADRLEVCSALASGGVTPSFGLAKHCVAKVRLPVMMMIRPHDGGFVYDDEDFETMQANIEIARSIGAQGVVFGALTETGRVHLEHCERLLRAAAGMETTFHRAFDVVVDPIEALDEIVELGFHRLLTSGQAAAAMDGADLIRELRERGGDRIVVMPGAGVNAQNAQRIVETTGVSELHASASVSVPTKHQAPVAFGANRRLTSEALVRAIRQSLDRE